ncbi:hypothetical protein [Ralstonia insidiosa]|uniref:hypothetical protein n=1 Tax=Ralstonia insidiosa TaxID=190721 RepID=UPI001427CF2C|nr:hypothetical protein [Ralstonia insidiosa]
MDRGTGRTTAQMEKAPTAAVFIWCNDRLDYPKRLARSIKRRDLQIVGPGWLENGWIGRRFTGIVVDHAAHLSPQKIGLLTQAISRVESER